MSQTFYDEVQEMRARYPDPLSAAHDVYNDAKSPKFTKKAPCDSGSFTGMPLKVTLVLVISVPLMRNDE